MNVFFDSKTRLLRPITVLRRALCVLFVLLAIFSLAACNVQTDYFSYVSELRDNVLLANNDVLTLRVYSLTKESPYAADGIVGETFTRTELRIVVPSGDKTCSAQFTVNGETYGGDASYDNVKAEYFLSCSVNCSSLKTLDVTITYGEQEYALTAQSVVTDDVLTPKKALNTLIAAEKELFDSLTDRYGFAGEIYLRLIYEESPYYYVGVIERNGNTHAFLINAKSGKILARRQS